MQRELVRVGDIGVMRLSGLCGAPLGRRRRLERRPLHRAIVIDLAALQGWNGEGEAAVVNAAGRLGADHGLLAVCGLAGRDAPLLAAARGLGVLRLYSNVDTALAALAPH